MKLSKHIAIGVLAIGTITMFSTTKVEATTAIVDVDSLYLREEASASSDVVDGLIKGQQLDVLEKLDGWYKVIADGETGYVSADYVKIQGEIEKTETETTTQTETETKIENEQNVETNTNNVEEQKSTENNTADTDNKQKQEINKVNEFKTKEGTLVNDAKAYILPLINSNSLKELKNGTKLTLVDEVNGWFYVQDEEINGWVLKAAFGEVSTVEEKTSEDKTEQQEEAKTEDATSKEVEIEKKLMYVNTDSINVRQGPDTSYEVADVLEINDKVYIIAEIDDWYKVEYGEKTGYIAKRLLEDKEQNVTSRSAEERNIEKQENIDSIATTTISNTNSKGEEIVEFAKQYLGCPYVYGGSGPSTFDCSGFTMYVYNNFGINMSHSAQAQSRMGEYVAKEDLQPGDLVFFLDYETMDEIGHVGIYVGDGNFIHASSGTGYCVKISTLLSGSYDVRYDTARRVI